MQHKMLYEVLLFIILMTYHLERVNCNNNTTNSTFYSLSEESMKSFFKNECIDKKINITEYKLIEEVRNFLDYHISDILVNFTKYDPEHKKYFEKILDGDNEALKELIGIAFFPYIASFSVAGITFIMFIFYIVCSYKQCCCCDKLIIPNTGCHLAYVIVGSIFTLSISICSIFGYLLLQDLNPNINNFNCGIIDFFINTKFGDEKSGKPKWIGYNNFHNFLGNLSLYYHEVNNSVFEQQIWMKEEDKKIKERLNEIENLYSTKQIQDPNYRSNNKITPDFIRVSNSYFKEYWINQFS